MKCALVRRTGDGRAVTHAERHPTGRGPRPGGGGRTPSSTWRPASPTGHAPTGSPRSPSGVAVPGVVDEAHRDGGLVGERRLPRRAAAPGSSPSASGLPAALGHDVRAGGVAEARLGAGRGSGTCCSSPSAPASPPRTWSTGRCTGARTARAGEIGHIVVRPGGPHCGCGQRGCLEAVASAPRSARRYAEAAAPASPSTWSGRRVPGWAPGSRSPPPTWRDAPPPARTWPARSGTRRSSALADGLLIAAPCDAEVIVLGGGLAEAGDPLLDAAAGGHARPADVPPAMPRLVPAALGDEAGCLGAALLGLTPGRHHLSERSTLPSSPRAGAHDSAKGQRCSYCTAVGSSLRTGHWRTAYLTVTGDTIGEVADRGPGRRGPGRSGR